MQKWVAAGNLLFKISFTALYFYCKSIWKYRYSLINVPTVAGQK